MGQDLWLAASREDKVLYKLKGEEKNPMHSSQIQIRYKQYNM
jgi:hypothetical protein